MALHSLCDYSSPSVSDWEQHIKGVNPDGVTISDKLQGLR